jgi:hypothetical protein
MTQHDSKRREDWQRITLRLPPDLYRHLVESAEEDRQSLNSRIVDALQNYCPTAKSAKASKLGAESAEASWAKTILEVQRRLAEVELKLAGEMGRKPVMTRYTYGKGVEEAFRGLDIIEMRERPAIPGH